MKKDVKRFAAILSVLLLAWVLSSGCGSSTPRMSELDESYEMQKTRIAELEKEIEEREAARRDAERLAQEARAEAERARARAEKAASGDAADTMVPPQARPGECYARVLVPPVFATETEQVLVREAAEKIELVPASYGWEEKKLEVKEPTYRLEVVPATYEWVEERVMVKPPRKELQVIPAEFETVTEEVLVAPARTYWKKGRGLIERVDNATGEVMCLVEEPARYKTVAKQVVKTPATVREVEIPAEYETVKRMVVKTEATTRRVQVPGEYDTVRVMKEDSPSRDRKQVVPAEYRTITKQIMVQPSRMEWRRVFCETNMTADIVRTIQRRLQERGHAPGPIDGIYGPLTRKAVKSFQEARGLATGGLTYATLEALEVRI